jgi:hypothetical protein
MKESEITVSMPMTAYKELLSYREKYNSLKNELKSCVDTSLVDADMSSAVNLKIMKMIELCKKELPWKYRECGYSVVEE